MTQLSTNQTVTISDVIAELDDVGPEVVRETMNSMADLDWLDSLTESEWCAGAKAYRAIGAI